MKIVLLSVILSVAASVITTRFLTLRYFDVFDKYVKGLFDDIKNTIKEVIGNK